MRKINKISFLLVGLVIISQTLVANEKNVKPQKPFVLEISLWHSLTGDKIKYSIEVLEESVFSLSSKTPKADWNISGSTGKIVDNTIPVKLHFGWYHKESTGSVASDSEHTLIIGKKNKLWSGMAHGVWTCLSIARKWDWQSGDGG